MLEDEDEDAVDPDFSFAGRSGLGRAELDETLDRAANGMEGSPLVRHRYKRKHKCRLLMTWAYRCICYTLQATLLLYAGNVANVDRNCVPLARALPTFTSFSRDTSR